MLRCFDVSISQNHRIVAATGDEQDAAEHQGRIFCLSTFVLAQGIDYLDEAEEHSGQHEQMGLPPSPFKKRFREPVQLLDKMQGSALKKTRTSGVVQSLAFAVF